MVVLLGPLFIVVLCPAGTLQGFQILQKVQPLFFGKSLGAVFMSGIAVAWQFRVEDKTVVAAALQPNFFGIELARAHHELTGTILNTRRDRTALNSRRRVLGIFP